MVNDVSRAYMHAEAAPDIYVDECDEAKCEGDKEPMCWLTTRSMYGTRPAARQWQLKVTKMSEAGMLRVLESSIRVGVPVLLENVLEKLDPALDPVLLKQTYKSQGRIMLRLGDTDVDYSEDFQFFVTTKLANPHYSPEVCIKVTLVNFTVTFEGLEDQVNPNPSAGPNPHT